MNDVPHQVKFKCKCVICGTIEYKFENQIEPDMGPMCSQCMGPMTVERVDVKVLKPGRW